jgi:diguanylate cyclase (GGDEF)-like protein
MTGQGLFTFKKFDSQTHLNHPQSELSNSTLAGLNWILVSFIAAPVFHPWILIFYISGTLLLLALLAIYSWSNAKANCQRMQAEQKLKDQATRDDLTGLANRHLFYERAVKVLSQSERMQHRFAVLFVDLDRFKQVNDELGHEAGDALLVEAAKRMQGIIRKPDTAARFGGDEFILLIPELKNTESVNAIAKKLIAALNEPFTLVKRGCTVEACIGASVGISIYPQDGAEIDILIRAADAAMYRAKNQGTGQYCQA